MKRGTMVGKAVVAAGVVALSLVPLASGAATRSTAKAAGATLPPRLVALERKMAELQINTARLAVDEVWQGPRGKHEGVFERLGRPRVTHPSRTMKSTLLSAIEEVSQSPAEETVRGRSFGAIVEERRIGGEIYLHEPFLAKLDGGPRWLEESRRGLEEEGIKEALPVEEGQSVLLAWIARMFGGAKSVAAVGAAHVGGADTFEFSAAIAPADMYRYLLHEHAKGGGRKLFRRIQRAFARAKVTLSVWFEADGLPVKIEVRTVVGEVTLDATVRYLAIEIPVSVEAPPARETITEAELKAEEKRARSK
jgi:hypothetical protein